MGPLEWARNSRQLEPFVDMYLMDATPLQLTPCDGFAMPAISYRSFTVLAHVCVQHPNGYAMLMPYARHRYCLLVLPWSRLWCRVTYFTRSITIPARTWTKITAAARSHIQISKRGCAPRDGWGFACRPKPRRAFPFKRQCGNGRPTGAGDRGSRDPESKCGATFHANDFAHDTLGTNMRWIATLSPP